MGGQKPRDFLTKTNMKRERLAIFISWQVSAQATLLNMPLDIKFTQMCWKFLSILKDGGRICGNFIFAVVYHGNINPTNENKRGTVPFQLSVQSQVTNAFELSTSGVSSWVTGHHEHLTVSIFAIFLHILLTNEQFWCLSRPKFGSWTLPVLTSVTPHTLWTVGWNGTVCQTKGHYAICWVGGWGIWIWFSFVLVHF